MTALIALIRKDLILFLSNRRALLLSLLMPIMLGAFFFGYLFGGSGATDGGKIDVALVQLDDSAASRKIAAGLKSDKALNVLELSLAEAQDKVRKGKLNAAVVLPAGFGDAAKTAFFFSGRNKPEIALYYDPSQNAVLAMLKGMLTQHVMQKYQRRGIRRERRQFLSQYQHQAAGEPGCQRSAKRRAGQVPRQRQAISIDDRKQIRRRQ
ncbi:ABC transporter permease [Undibacterium arcticum]